jgi:hypothetical protein
MSLRRGPQQLAVSNFKKKPTKAKLSKTFSISAKILAFFSIIGTTLASIGEGVAMSAEGVVDIPHQLLVGSPFDLIELSIWAAVQMINALTAIRPRDVAVGIGVAIFPIIFGLFIFLSLLSLCRRKLVHIQTTNLFSAIKRFFQPPRRADSDRMLIAKTGLFGALFTTLAPAVGVFGLFATIILIGFITLPTALGFVAGRAHIQKYVIEPTACAPLKNRSDHLHSGRSSKVVYAQCVAVANDRRDFGRGRVVFTTSTAIVLFDPVRGNGWRVPTKDASVETVESLIVPPKEKSGISLKGNNAPGVAGAIGTEVPAEVPSAESHPSGR